MRLFKYIAIENKFYTQVNRNFAKESLKPFQKERFLI